MIIIVDYGMGNLHSVKRAIQYVAPNIDVRISSNALDIQKASHIILPGQGGMADCMKALSDSNLKQSLLDTILNKKTPTLGICLGMQMLFEQSEEGRKDEHGNVIPSLGLGILEGKIKRFSKQDIPNHNLENNDVYKVPHMGWNTIKNQSNLLASSKSYPNIWQNIANDSHFYFIHSYYLPLNQQTKKYAIATCEYGVDFVCAVAHENIIATQFHPEKSADSGLQLYRNFINLA
jgi:glutamine amidotransferase